MPLTIEQKRWYVRHGSVHCPYCDADDLEGGFVAVDGIRAVQAMSCLTCQRRWEDVYILSEIVEGGDADEAPPPV